MSQAQAMSLEEIYQLAFDKLMSSGADEHNATILSTVLRNAERDGSHSHGLFRLPAYVTGLKSKKINGDARAEVNKITSSFIRVDGNRGLAPTAHDASSSPKPHSSFHLSEVSEALGLPFSSLEFLRISFISTGVRLESACNINATTPDTIGVAIDVPSLDSYELSASGLGLPGKDVPVAA